MKHNDENSIRKVHKFLGIEDDDNSLKDWVLSLFSKKDIHLTVGAGGDYTTLNGAIDYIKSRAFYPLTATITLLPSFVMREQVILRGIDLSFLTIVSKTTVNVEARQLKECIRVNASPEFEVVPIFYGQNSIMPIIDAKFMYIDSNIMSDQCVDCNTLVSGLLVDNSKVMLKSGNGFTHFPFLGVCGINGAHITAHHCDFSHSGNRHELNETSASQAWYGDGVRTWNSTFSGSYAIADRCGDMGFHFSQGSQAFINKAKARDCGHHAILTTGGSTCSAREGIFTDTIDDNVVAYASSKIDLRRSDCSRSKINYGVIATRTSEINFEGGISNDCGFSGTMANRGSSVDFTGGISNNNVMHGIECANNSRVDFSLGVADRNKVDGIHITHGSTVQGRESKVRNNARKGVLAFSGIAYMSASVITGNERNLEATRGGSIFAYQSDLSNAKEKGVLAYGSKIFINGSTVNNSGQRGIEATQGGEITAENCIINGSRDKGVLAYGAKIVVSNSTVNGSGGRSIEATQGGEIIANNVKVSGHTGNTFSIYSGGRIIAPNSVGTGNRIINTMSEHGYIISNNVVGLSSP